MRRNRFFCLTVVKIQDSQGRESVECPGWPAAGLAFSSVDPGRLESTSGIRFSVTMLTVERGIRGALAGHLSGKRVANGWHLSKKQPNLGCLA
jgi:hypothetical protein